MNRSGVPIKTSMERQDALQHACLYENSREKCQAFLSKMEPPQLLTMLRVRTRFHEVLLTPDGKITVLVVQNPKDTHLKPKRTKSYIDEVYRLLEEKPGVEEILIMNRSGVPIKTSMERQDALQHACLYENSREKCQAFLSKMEPPQLLTMLRVRTRFHEVLLTPDGKITVLVVQNPKDTHLKPKRTKSYIDEVYRLLEEKPGVEEILIMNRSGVPIKTSMERQDALQHACLYENSREKCQAFLSKMEPPQLLTMLRVRTRFHEVLLTPDGKITVLVVQNPKDTHLKPKRTKSYIDEVYRLLEEKPGVEEILIMNRSGVPIKTSMERQDALQHACLYENSREKCQAFLSKMEPPQLLTMLRVRTRFHEVLLTPDGKITVLVVQNPKDTHLKPKRTKSYIDEVYRLLEEKPGVEEILIMNRSGVPIKTSMERQDALQHACLYENSREKCQAFLSKMEPPQLLTMLRVRTRFHEVLLTPDGKITVLVVQNPKDTHLKPKRTKSYIDEVYRLLEEKPGVEEILIMNRSGVPIKTSMERQDALQHACLYENSREKCQAFLSKMEPPQLLTMLRVRTRFHEVLLTPDGKITVLVVQNPKDTHLKPKRTKSYIDEVYRLLEEKPGVEEILIMNRSGVAIKSSMERQDALQHACLYENSREKCQAFLSKMEPPQLLTMLRVRTRFHEVLLTPDGKITVLVVQNPKDTHLKPKRTKSYIDEVYRLLEEKPGVEEILIMNRSGVLIKTSMERQDALQHACLYENSREKCQAFLSKMEPPQLLTILRVRTRFHEVLLTPVGKITVLVVQNPKDTNLKVEDLTRHSSNF
ncbi:uncharacterized protein LOC108159435 isoform X7 [Drosophila miranda]|nr:uncharacterized protein LOC108159435 isoform X7 [Drosophila miranda]